MRFQVSHNIPLNLGSRFVELAGQAAEAEAEEAKRLLDDITDDWDNKPEFQASSSVSGSEVVAEVSTDSVIFNWVDKGVKSHRIPRAGRKLMLFDPDYFPKTARAGPGRFLERGLGSLASRITFARKVVAFEVNHPGIEARNFTGTVGENMRRRLITRLLRSIARFERSLGTVGRFK